MDKRSFQIIGILNITPDSFSDGGLFLDPAKALEQAKKLFDEGADIVDVGGESTKPGASKITPDAEWDRIKNVLKELVKAFPGKISLDTKNPKTAEKFLKKGGTILNDVSGFQDPQMIQLAAKHRCLCLVNHFPGKTATEVHTRKLRSPQRIARDLLQKKNEMIKAGILNKNIVLDPGIGFGKTMKCNQELLHFAQILPQEQILIGHSRKRFLGPDRFEDQPNKKAGLKALKAGAQYLRVHTPSLYI